MARIIVVTSGKGGVGKTTSSAAIATGLAQKGKKTVVIDFDIGLRNLDLIMGCERRVVYDFVNVIQGDATLNQALIKDKRTENLFILPASQTRDKDALTREGVAKVLDSLKAMDFELVKKMFEFDTKFKEKQSTIICEEILGDNIAENLEKIEQENTMQRKCPQAVNDAIDILEEMFEEK